MITQSTSRTGSEGSWFGSHAEEVSSLRLASSFLSKQGMMARCHICEGAML